MNQQYTARIYSNEKIIQYKSGDDIEKLYIWMLAEVSDTPGDIRGEIIDNATTKVVRHFKKAPVE
ncbi:TPA: hypothetical protein JAJ32_002883 [Legionella pneumophila]|uniref:Uncharacterized protein n=9 Tax=Legionellaceae TaxID=444 RepID=A0A378KL42_9GAMM|nr:MULTISPECIES: hypothetical protein [Legionellaceae]AMV16174.1 hypothetical protein ULM_35230 [Legionella pneumophila]AUH74121.1 hypothetical protein CAB17_19375 [Legionella sainthelensi]KTC67595.1 hypothetical protein Lani_3163 [Legionella anisa]KTC82971.1 hypothetical protein Lche_0194 [Legionella cherrii]KTD15752.1 hypothetical protein Lgra_0005 [Legionella gratiana]